ncbi:MAG: hypothetical protein AAB426_07085, partial [Myxococcota bacterium]
ASAHTAAAIERPEGVEPPRPSKMHPSRRGPDAAASRLEQRVESVRDALRGEQTSRARAAREALTLAASYPMRRSRGARKQAGLLCDEVGEVSPEHAEDSHRLRDILRAEGLLHELRADATLEACLALVRMLENEKST